MKYSFEDALFSSIEGVCRKVGSFSVDTDRTTITGYARMREFVKRAQDFGQQKTRNLDVLKSILSEWQDIMASGMVVFKDIEDVDPAHPAVHKPTETKPETTKPADVKPKEISKPSTSTKPAETAKPAEPAKPEEKPVEEPAKPKPVPRLIPFEDRNKEIEKPIDWIPDIPSNKYLIRKRGDKVTIINRATNKPAPIQVTSEGPKVKLTGLVKPGRRNPTTREVLIRDLTQRAFPTMPKPDQIDTTGTGKVHLEDVSVPFDLKAMTVKPKLTVRMEDITDEYVYIDFVKGIQKDKYKVNKHGDVFNTMTSRKITIGKASNSDVPRVSLNNSYFAKGEGWGHGQCRTKQYNLMHILIIAFLCKEKVDIDILTGRKLRKLDESKPWALDNIDLEEYEDVL